MSGQKDKKARTKRPHVVCRAADLPPGERRIVEVEGRSLGVFNIDGEYHAIPNRCPHQWAPLCKGTLAKTAYAERPDEWDWDEASCVIRCPWHGWEFDIRTGRSVFNPHRMGVRSYEVTVETAGAPAARQVAADEEEPSLETFEVTVEGPVVVVHL